MKLLIYAALVLILIPFAFADITITNLQRTYTLGEKIQAVFEITPENSSATGIFKASLECDDYKLDYFANMVELVNGKQTFNTGLKTSEQMIGNCRIKTSFISFDNKKIFSDDSDKFAITNKLEITFSLNKEEFFPGEEVAVSVSGLSAYSQREFTQTAFFNSEEKGTTFKLSNNLKSGSYDVLASVKDNFGNSAEELLTLKVKQVPTKIEAVVENKELLPEQNANVRITILDQAGDEIKGKNVIVSLMKQSEQISSKSVLSGEIVSFELPKFIAPGEYTISSSSEQLKDEDKITVLPVRQADITFQGSSAYITNVGNVEYAEEIFIEMKGEETAVISKNVDLNPGEIAIIDLSKEVPGGTYSVAPLNGTYEPVMISFAENRGIVKRTTDGVAAVTGAVTGGGITSFIVPLTLVALMILVIYFYYKKKTKVLN